MRSSSLFSTPRLCMAALCAALPLFASHATAAPAAQPLPLRWIINTGPIDQPRLIQNLQVSLGVPVRLVRPMMQPGSVLVELQSAPRFAPLREASALLAAMNALPGVRFASPDLPIRRAAIAAPNDPVYASNQAAYMDSSNYASLGMRSVWQQTRGSSNVVLAVLDSGVLFNHPDLKGRLLPGYDFVSRVTPPTGQSETGQVADSGSNDGDGRDANPADPGDAPPPGSTCGDGSTDSSFHGTAVASVAAAQSNNASLLTGMDWNAKVLPVRVSGRCGIASSADIVDAFYWASGSGRVDPTIGVNPNPANVINLSFATDTPLLGGSGCTGGGAAAVRQAIADAVSAGVSVVISAGNNGGGGIEFPANCPGAIAASAAQANGQLATYTAKGSSSEGAITIAAPGDANGRYTGASNPGLPNGQPDPNRNNAVLFSGTSFSAPMVAGAITLLKAVQPDLAPAQVVTILRSSARAYPTNANFTAGFFGGIRRGGCTPSSCGAGLLNPLEAISIARSQGNARPVANVPASMVVSSSGGVSLDASLSSNSAGGSGGLSFAWRQVSGNPVGLAGTSTSSVFVQSGLANNIAEIQLTVTDASTNRSNSASVRLVGSGVNEQTFRPRSTNVNEAPEPGSPSASGGGTSGGGGGGGGMGLLGLFGLAILVASWRRLITSNCTAVQMHALRCPPRTGNTAPALQAEGCWVCSPCGLNARTQNHPGCSGWQQCKPG
ncbi:MAG TPA: S8 family serine peptidase [Limnobacter sp.]|nr:S8 family serine peptidase [Limnobacter sp.]